ncbi:MAG TPA: hypothetical protein VNP20_07240 [Nocardioidaceae bacterium]|nr:hypothetical protein [Nocardioidaceae bacterium]
MRDGMLPAAVITAAVIAFVAYLSFQGSAHAVDFAVTSSEVAVVPADDPQLPQQWQQRAQSSAVMAVDVSWQAGESIAAGSYAVMVTTPQGWRHLGCRPVCEWTSEEGLQQFARRVPRTPYPLAATFEAEEAGDVRVAFRSPRGATRVDPGFAPTAWLVQTNGDDVLGARPVPLT